jgi:hypothetical protein
MSVVTVADVLLHAERFERLLADYYRCVAAGTAREGVRLLTDYMSRHRVRLTEKLADLDADLVGRIAIEPIRYRPQAADCRCFEGVELPPEATAAQVLDAAVQFDECLVSLYRQAARQTNHPESRALFESLIRAEERDEIELKKIKAMDYF